MTYTSVQAVTKLGVTESALRYWERLGKLNPIRGPRGCKLYPKKEVDSFERPYTLTEAAEKVGVHMDTLRSWTDTGKAECHRTPGGHRRFTEDQINQARQRNEQRR